MQDIIEEILAVAALAKEVSWNMRGIGSLSLRPYLDNALFNGALRQVGLIADHMVSTGLYGDPRFTLGNFETFPQLLVKPDPRRFIVGVEQVIQQLTYLTDLLDEYLVNETDDPVGQHIITGALQEFNNHHWRLSCLTV